MNYQRFNLRPRNEPPPLSPLVAIVGGSLALAALFYAFMHLWLRLPVERWMR